MVTTTDMCDLDELSVQQLQEEVAALAAHIYAGTCRWLELPMDLELAADAFVAAIDWPSALGAATL